MHSLRWPIVTLVAFIAIAGCDAAAPERFAGSWGSKDAGSEIDITIRGDRDCDLRIRTSEWDRHASCTYSIDRNVITLVSPGDEPIRLRYVADSDSLKNPPRTNDAKRPANLLSDDIYVFAP